MKKRKVTNYTLEFKQKAVELTYARGNIKQIAEELDVYPSLLYR
jgi:transposase|tara:strand:- start:1505 stop:1636 length:132 start_codon:yes stop_codon:yes gene_type:complete